MVALQVARKTALESITWIPPQNPPQLTVGQGPIEAPPGVFLRIPDER
jgi:hypothetical protein